MSRTLSGRCRIVAFAVSLVLLPGAWLASPAAHAATASDPSATAAAPHLSGDSGPAVHHDTSPSLRSMAAEAAKDRDKDREKGDKHEEPEEEDRLPHPPASPVPDPVVQDAPGGQTAPSTGSNFEGIGQGTYTVSSAPPDPNASVGSTQIVEIVNTAYAVYSKTGATVLPPTNTNTVFSGFGGPCQSTNDGDPTVRWDGLADRWVITQFANIRSTTGPYFECVAVSTGPDATGSYHRYAFQYANFNDYPKLSVWPDAYYVTYNMFTPAGAFAGAEVCALNRDTMLAGAAAAQQCFTTSAFFGGLLASDLDGSTPPPAGAPNVQVSLGQTSSSLSYWKFHVDWVTPANSRFTGPTSLAVAPYTTACDPEGTCIPQGGTTQELDALSDRLMYRLAYRNFGDHESLVVNHSVNAGGSVGVRWYELRMAGGNPTVFQQGTYAPDTFYRWMGSVAMDKAGNIGMGYSHSSAAVHPSIRVTGRLAGDAPGAMTQGETTLITGAGSQTGLARWGDYTSMAVDPSDGCTFWYTGEYEPANGSFNWRTRIGSFTLPNCADTATDDFSVATSPTSRSVTAGSAAATTVSTAVTSGSAHDVTLSASGLPAGATATFSPSSVTAGGSATLTVATSASSPSGTYPLTVTGTGSATHSATFTLTVSGGSAGGCVGETLNFTAYPTLQSGSSGTLVRAAQCLLRGAGFSTSPGDPTQIFDEGTAAATKAFQQAHGLAQTGIVESHTWTALLSFGSTPTLQSGSTGSAVTRLQRALTAALSRTVGIDGQFGPMTEQAVRDYQSSRGLGADGIVGPQTWGALQAGK